MAGRKRLSGEGTVYEEKDARRRTRYVAERYVELPNGTTKRVRVRAHTQREALNKLRAREEALIRSNPDAERLTLRTYLRDWIENKRGHIKPATLDKYARTLNDHVIPHVGHIPLTKFQPVHGRRLITAILNTPSRATSRRVDGPMIATANNARSYLMMALRDAERLELIQRNPLRNIAPVRAPPVKRGVWTRDEITLFLQSAEGTRWHALFMTAIMTGLRRGELAALKWDDITPTTLHVRATETLGGIGEPKSAAGRRAIPLSTDLQQALQQHREEYPGGAWVFGTQNGTRCEGRWIHRAFTSHIKKSNVTPVRFHDLRRIAATLWARKGFPPKLIQQLLGHATPHMALHVYQDVLEEQREGAHLSLADITSGGNNGGNTSGNERT